MDSYKTFRIGNSCCTISVLSIMTFLYFCKQSFTNMATAIGFSTAITAGLILIPFLLMFVYISLKYIKRIKWDAVVLYFACVLLFVVTIHIHPEYSDRFNDIYNNGRFSATSVFSLGAGIYTYYIIRMFEDDVDRIYSVFKVIPFAVFFLNLGTLINKSSEYAMDFGYQMGMAAILFIAQYLYEEKNYIKLFMSFASITMGVLYGARATVLGYVVFISMFMIWQKRVTLKKGVILGIGIIAAMLYNSQTFMTNLYNYLLSLGFHSRTIYLLASGDVLSSDTARQERIWPVLINLLNNSSLFKMYGAYGDRYYLNPHYPYAHNIVLEILVTFGKGLGLIIIIYICVNFIITCIENRTAGGLLTLIFGSFSLSRLMISSSFWIEPYFWAFLAIMVNCKILRKKHCYEL